MLKLYKMKFGVMMEKYGFSRVSEYELSDIEARAVEYRHTISGAKLIHIDRKDENKTFMIAFKTPPTDSTGVFHIIEHSVLCGSEKYPVKEPFVELLKGSLNTFLNAMTFPDKTVYPVSSMNDKDFLNLVSVYMDAVFSPAFLKDEKIFAQEGHRLTISDGKPCENGVVLNEMLGAYSSPEEIEAEKMMELLYPDSPYSYSSGGDPDEIVNLTYEDFVSVYKKHYKPSEAYIVLDGLVNLDEVLPLLDEYLCLGDVTSSKVNIPDTPKPLGVDVKLSYPIGEDEDSKDKTRVSVGIRTFAFNEREKNVALAVVRGAIASSSGSPFCRAVLDTGLCEEVIVAPIEEIRDGAITISFLNVKDGCSDELVDFALSKLRDLATSGIDKDALSSSLDSFEFYTREKNYGTLPAGVVYALTVMESWLYSDNPVENLVYGDVFKSLREKVDTDYYDKLLLEIIPKREESVVLTLVPDGECKGRLDAMRAERAEAKWKALSERGQKKQMTLSKELDAWQSTPDTKEALQCLPALSVNDINPFPEKIKSEEKEIMSTKVGIFDIKTAGITYINAYFNVEDFTVQDCLDLGVLASALGRVETESFTEEELANQLKSKVGFMNLSATAILHEDGSVKNTLKLSTGLLSEKISELPHLLSDVLLHSRFDGRNITKLVKRSALAMRENMCADGTSLALDRTNAAFSAASVINDYYSGYEAYLNASAYAEGRAYVTDLAKRLEILAKRVFTKERARLFIAGAAGDSDIEKILAVFPHGEGIGVACEHKPTFNLREGIELPVGIAFTALGFEMPKELYTSAFNTVKTILNYEYLWGEIRAKGGAYGAGQTLREGFGAFYSYRDPKPSRSFDKYLEAADFLEKFASEISDAELEKYIIGTFSSIDGVRTPRLSFDLESIRAMRGIDYETRVQRRREVLESSRKDLFTFAKILRQQYPNAAYCTVASHETLKNMGNTVSKIHKIV